MTTFSRFLPDHAKTFSVLHECLWIIGASISLLCLLIHFSTRAQAQSQQSVTNPLSPQADLFFEQLFQQSSLVVRGRIDTVVGKWTADHSIESVVTMTPYYSLNGTVPQQITVITPGGRLPEEDLELRISHEASFVANEEVLLFLSQKGKSYRVTMQEAGKYAITDGYASNPQGERVSLEALIAFAQSLQSDAASSNTIPSTWRQYEAPAATRQHAVPAQFVLSGGKWPQNEVKYRVYANSIHIGEQNGEQNGTREAFKQAIIQAGDIWSELPDADFTYLYDGDHTSITQAYNGVNEIFWVSYPDKTALAFTRSWLTNGGSTLIEADIWLNDRYKWDATGQLASDEFDVTTAALHEFGHAFGLGHDSETGTVMYPSVSSGTLNRTPTASDRAGVSTLYPCGTPPCSPQSASTLAIQADQAATLTVTTTEGFTTQLNIAASSVETDTVIRYQAIAAANLPTALPNSVVATDYAFALNAVQSSGSVAELAFSEAVTLTIHYPAANLAGVDESLLQLLAFDPTDQQWKEGGCGDYLYEADQDQLMVPICYVASFALVAKVSKPEIIIDGDPATFLYTSYIPLLRR